MAPRSGGSTLAVSLFTLVASTLAFACGAPSEPATPAPPPASPSGPSASTATTSTSTASGSAGDDAGAASTPGGKPTPGAASGSAATTTPAAGGSGTDAKAPAAGSGAGIETAIKPKTTSAGGSYAVGTISADGIDEADVIQTLNAAAGKTDACYVPLFKKQLSAKGVTNFEVTIDAKGKTKSVTLKENETKSGELAKCLGDVVRGITWPAPRKAPAKTTVAWVVSGN